MNQIYSREVLWEKIQIFCFGCEIEITFDTKSDGAANKGLFHFFVPKRTS